MIGGRVSVFNNVIQSSGDCALYSGATQIDKAEFELEASAGINISPLQSG